MTRRLTESILIADLIVVIASLYAAVYVRSLAEPIHVTLWPFLALWWPIGLSALALWTILYVHMRLDGFRGGWHFPAMASQLTLGIALLITLMLALGSLQRQYYSRFVLLLFAVFVLIGFVLVRCCARSLVASRTRSGRARNVVILGSGNIALELARKIARHPELMLHLVGFLSPEPLAGTHGSRKPAMTEASQPVTSLGVMDTFRTLQVEEIIVALPDASARDVRKMITLCRSQGCHVSIIPQWYELYMSEARLFELDGLPMISLENKSLSPVSLFYKKGIDLVLGSVFLLACAPVLLLISAFLLIRRGRAFKSEVRCGMEGTTFRMFRFNIDREHPETMLAFERLVAGLSLTELPQLWNVLKGDMSLVGPRPEPVDRVRHYSDWQRQRLTVMPGLTGLAQVYGLREQHSSEEKARFDLQYIYHWSPFLDLSLILQTAWTLAVRLWHSERSAAAEESNAMPHSVPFSEVVSVNRTHTGAN